MHIQTLQGKAGHPRVRSPNFPNPLLLSEFFLAILAATPVLALIATALQPPDDVWAHLTEHTLSGLLANTAILVVGVGGVTLLLGTGLGWLTAMYEFPGRWFFSWALVLPLALPTYVLAFIFLGTFDYAGPVQGVLVSWFDIRPLDIRGAWSVVVVMSLALYPYVYVLAKGAFRTQGRGGMEAARTLGRGPVGAFFGVALPMARPWLATGVLLVVMEALADFGAVAVFNFDTFTTAIYKAWFGMFSLESAARLASVLVVVMFAMAWAEQRLRRRMRFTEIGQGGPAPRSRLAGGRGWVATALCAAVFLVAFLLPCIQLVLWVVETYSVEFSGRYPGYVARTVFLGFSAAVAVCAGALVLSYAKRLHGTPWVAVCARIAVSGYALPGTVLAVSVVIVAAWLDGHLIGLAHGLGMEMGAVLQGGVAIMVVAYMIRFLAVGFGPVDGAMLRISRSMDDAARVLGVKGTALLRRVHLPMLRNGVAAAAALAMVEVMKEMPLTLMTRPFGWDTLAVRIYDLTAEGEFERAAAPALVLALVGIIPAALLARKTDG